MQDPRALDHYFTEQVVGEAFVVEMGPSAGVRREPAGGLRLNLLSTQAELFGNALRGHAAPGQPASEQALARARRHLQVLGLLAFLALWSVALWWAFGHVGPAR
ncbi:MAG: hypothetical protein U1F53_11800 [Burkholderiaceae bacterium]